MTKVTAIISAHIGRTVLTAAALSTALGLASAAQARDDMDGFRTSVESGIDQTLRVPGRPTDMRKGIATVAVTVDALGRVQTTDLVRSSGIASFDREALRTAHVVSYPATGKARTVAMVLGFNQTVSKAEQGQAQNLVLAWREEQRVMLAHRTAAQQPDG